MIYVVDDDPSVLRSIERFLRTRGPVEAFASAAAVLDRLRAARPDVLLSDLDLAGARGEDVALAAKVLHPTPRIILMSGCPDRLAAARPLADAVLLKPFGLPELLDLV
jgi:DNA-binding response OmpR family regulator